MIACTATIIPHRHFDKLTAIGIKKKNDFDFGKTDPFIQISGWNI